MSWGRKQEQNKEGNWRKKYKGEKEKRKVG